MLQPVSSDGISDAAESLPKPSGGPLPVSVPLHALPSVGYVRLRSIIGPGRPIPVGKSTWWEGVRTGRFPKPIKLGPKITVWRVEDIRTLIEKGIQ